VVANFADADENTAASAYSASIAWGDGTISTGTVTTAGGGFAVDGSHTYVEEGSFAITVQVSDLDATATSATSTATVTDAGLTGAGLHLKQINDRVNAVVATFSDADPEAVAGDYSASITWGDGTRSAGTVFASGGGFVVWGSHHYLRDTEWAVVKVRISDAGGSVATATTTARE
jgi:hypothetical protein